MGSMSPMSPEAIGKLTIVQLLCMGSKTPPDRERITSAEGLAELDRADDAWREKL